MRRSWNRVASWEMRILKDLIEYTTNVDDFMHIRLTTESMVEAKPVEIGSHTTSSGGAMDSQSSKTKNLESKVVLPSACVPFIV
jgi:GDP/GTP exchange factor required for growth at low temperature